MSNEHYWARQEQMMQAARNYVRSWEAYAKMNTFGVGSGINAEKDVAANELSLEKAAVLFASEWNDPENGQ